MKKIIIFIIVISLFCVALFMFINSGKASLKYDRYGTDISVSLTQEERDTVASIFKGYKTYSRSSSCGYSSNVSIKVGNTRYDIALDGCNSALNCSNFKYIDLTKEEIDVIHDIFAKYGGHFPCS